MKHGHFIPFLLGVVVLLMLGAGVNSIHRFPDTRAGSVALTALEVSKSVVFDRAMSDTNYVLTFAPGVASLLSWSSKTVSGFTLNLSVGITGRVDYLAWPLP